MATQQPAPPLVPLSTLRGNTSKVKMRVRSNQELTAISKEVETPAAKESPSYLEVLDNYQDGMTESKEKGPDW